MRRSLRALYASWIALMVPMQPTIGFGIPEIFSTGVYNHHADSILPFFLNVDASNSLDSFPSNLYIAYKQALVTDPLPTKMTTGALLALVGDGIAQRCVGEADECSIYDSKRAIAFATFDACYRAVQHAVYPPMVAFFQGQYLNAAFVSVMAALGMATTGGNDYRTILAAIEQALVSQLVIIPFLYYPVFYTITGFVQGLSFDETLERARETFIPLMERNLLFWIPVQFAVFGFCEEPLQIPVLTLCGLAWTFILSLVAGSVQTTTQEEVAMANEKVVVEEVYDTYCVTGMEPHCLIDPDDLFHAPHHPVFRDANDSNDEQLVGQTSLGVPPTTKEGDQLST